LKRVWRKRVWRKRVWRTRGWRQMESEVFDGRVRVPYAKGNNGTHRTLDSAVDFGQGHLSSGTAPRRATYHRRICRKAPRRGIPVVSRAYRNHVIWT